MRRALAVALCLSLPAAARASDLRYFDDAALHAVQFVDKHEGWAVGDEGVVWHTIDGGKSWERQATGVRASLRSLFFLNPYVGWVVGREELPDGSSTGIVLYTKDGGLSFKRLMANSVPGLSGVRFSDPKTGYLLGDGSDQVPTGLLQTKDGGRTWQVVAGPRCPGWLAGDFEEGQPGALAGPWCRLAVLRQDRLSAADVDKLGGRTLRGLYRGDKKVWAVGQGGLVLTSTSGGARWGFANLKLSEDLLASLDFAAVHGAGQHLWVAGRPGSVVLHSPDGGQTWEFQKTGQNLPLNHLWFNDAKSGWAVGEYGTILATEDGGKTWKLIQGGGRRGAVLAVHARAEDIPAEVLSQFGALDGYLTTVLRVTAPDRNSAPIQQASAGPRLACAVREAGAASGEMLWQFPLPQHLQEVGKEALLKAWNQDHGDRADRELLRQMVLALRTWRPDLVLTDLPDGPGSGALVAEALHVAFAQAADPKAFPEQIEQLGLQPWGAKRLFGHWRKRGDAQVVFTGEDFSPLLEGSPRDFAQSAARLLGAPLPRERFFRLLDDRANSQTVTLASSLSLAGSDARRKAVEASAPKQELIKAVKARQQLERMLEAPPQELTDPGKMLGQLHSLRGLPDNQAANALYVVGKHYAREGHWSLARETFLLMADRHPAHPLTVEAFRWLIQHNTSSEARRRHELGQFVIETRVGSAKQEPKGPDEVSLPKMARQERLTFLSNRDEIRHWFKGSLALGERLDGFGPQFSQDAGMQFCIQAARRHLGEFVAAEEWYSKYLRGQPAGPFREAALAELWLKNRIGAPPKAIAVCRGTNEKPFLDGKLDDSCWKDLPPMVLKNAVGETDKEYPTQAWLAYDNEFLYVAVRCKHPQGHSVPPVKARQRDADLRRFDRVSVLLDLDRDYATYYHLQIDQRGCVCEDCWGDKRWNPRWFVAVHGDDTGWQAEAAIPLAELTGDRLTIGTVWAANVVRVLPGRGVQAWSVPADVEPRPEGMGLVMFNQPMSRPAAKAP
jgi:photosystem II stability/assembly factor-like uncharacterized protein